VKNNCCLSERPPKAKKSGLFLSGISFFVLEILHFNLYHANEESDDVIGVSTITVQHSISLVLNITAVFLKPGTRNAHH